MLNIRYLIVIINSPQLGANSFLGENSSIDKTCQTVTIPLHRIKELVVMKRTFRMILAFFGIGLIDYVENYR